jgi:hypothetical protein
MLLVVWGFQIVEQYSNCGLTRLNKKSKTDFPYKMKGETLQKAYHQPYLGVELSNNLKYNLHIDQTCKKASKVLGFLKRNLKHCPCGLPCAWVLHLIFFASVLIFPNLDRLPFRCAVRFFVVMRRLRMLLSNLIEVEVETILNTIYILSFIHMLKSHDQVFWKATI